MATQPGNTVQQAPDGTTTEFGPDGHPVRLTLPDGSTYTSFDAAGRPVDGTVPGAGPVHISYAPDGESTWSFQDGTRIVRSMTGNVLNEVTPDGTTYTRFDADGRPTAGTVSGAGDVTISYQADGGSTWSFSDGTQLVRDHAGALVREALPDGSVFTGFDGQGRPTAGTVGGHDGQPAQAVSIGYDGGGGDTWTLQDGTRISHDAGGAVVHESLPDGSVFTGFDGQGRPTSGSVPAHSGEPPTSVHVSYQADGGSTWSFSDGTSLVRDAGGAVVHESLPDGSVFTGFDGQGRPTGGTVGGHDGQPAQAVSIGYDGGGGDTWTLQDGTRISHDAGGAVVHESLPDGSVFTGFDGQGRPTGGTVGGHDGQPAQAVSIGYDGGGGDTWTLQDQTKITHDASGTLVQEQLSDGTVYTKFDLDQRPIAAVVPGHDGQPAQSATIAYSADGGDTWTMQDNTRLMHNAGGALVEEQLPDGTVFTKFDAQQRPLTGVIPGTDGRPSQAVTIAYQDDGSGVWTYQDQSKLVVSPGGAVIRETTPDGWSFDAFDGQGRPTAGSNNGLSATIAYGDGGSSVWTLNDGTTLYRDGAGTLMRQTTPDGMDFTSFDVGGRPTGGTVPDVAGRSPVSIGYAPDGSSVWHIAGGPTLYRDPGGTVIREVTPDGWTFTSFNGDGLPTAGVDNGISATIAYVGDNSIWTLGDGTIITRDKNGATVRVETPDGGVFTSFDSTDRPVAGTVPDKNGGPPLPVTIGYTPDGGSVWDVGGAEIFKDANDKTFKMNADGWTFTNFNGNGDPTAADNGSMHADISYPGDGTSVWTYNDHTVVTRAADGHIVTLVDADGWTFTTFDTANRPTSGHKDGETVTISYQANGWSVWSYGDGTTVTRDGNTIKLETTPDGWSFNSFDGLGRPLAGTNGGTSATIVYDSDAQNSGSTWTLSDGTVMHRTADGTLTSMTTPDGWTFTAFDTANRPIAGHNGDKNATITYDAKGDSIWNFGPGQPILTYDKNGNLLTMQTPDGWLFDAFNGDKPTHGYNQSLNLSVDIYYNPDGTIEWDYSDGTTVITDGKGTPIEEIVPDGKGGYTDIVFAVDLAVMQKVITYTRNNQQTINDALTRIKTKMTTITNDWSGPAAGKYSDLVSSVTSVTNEFTRVFDDAVSRMQGAYNAYVNTEGANYANLQKPPPQSQWHRPPPAGT